MWTNRFRLPYPVLYVYLHKVLNKWILVLCEIFDFALILWAVPFPLIQQNQLVFWVSSSPFVWYTSLAVSKRLSKGHGLKCKQDGSGFFSRISLFLIRKNCTNSSKKKHSTQPEKSPILNILKQISKSVSNNNLSW